MSDSVSELGGLPLTLTRRRNALSLLFFLCTVFAFMLRFAVSPEMMDRVVDYTGDSGAFYEKLHFGTYAIIFLLPFVLFGGPFVLRGDEIGKFRALVRYCALIVALMAYLVVMGRLSSSGFLIDTYLCAGAAGLLMLAQSAEARRRLGDVTLCMLILSAAIGIGEAITRHRLLPYDAIELQFRPLGLSEHPLALGALCATAIGFTACTNWRIWIRVAAIFILLIGCAASGARAALLMAAGEVLVLLLFTPWPSLSPRQARRAKTVVFLFAMVGGAALVALLFAGGLLSRFGSTLFDDNFMVRISVYEVFGLVSWRDIMFGISGNELVAIVRKQLHLPTIESAPVAIIMLFGLPAAIFFATITVRLLWRLLRWGSVATWAGSATFLLASLSNNALSSKSPVVAIAVVLILAYANWGPNPAPAVAESDEADA